MDAEAPSACALSLLKTNMKKRHLLLGGLLALAGGANTMLAVTASPGLFPYRQPDGSTVTLGQRGDENFHYFVDADGYPVAIDADGWYRYIGADGNVTDVAVGNGKRTLAFRQTVADKGAIVKNYIERVKPTVKYRNELAPQKVTAMGKKKVLVILAEFADTKFTIGTHDLFNDMMNKRDYNYNGATGSCYDYFYENSMTQYQPQFDVYGPVQLSQGYAYYGEDKAGEVGQDRRAGEMVKEACQLLDDQIDFSQYDTDGDGFVDYVYVYYPGLGQHEGGDANTIWPHAHYLQYTDAGTLEADGVTIDRYATSNEIQGSGQFTGIGVFCHEFSHVLGLPDLYDTYNSENYSVGYWSLLCRGNYLNEGRTPPNLSSYERSAIGWLKPEELSHPADISMTSLNDNIAYQITTETPTEYYLFENRQRLGWDSFLPGHGMLVWHIDYNADFWTNNIVNTRPNHLRIDIVEADGAADFETTYGDPFPGTGNHTAFTDETSPSMLSWAGNRQNKPITDIQESAQGVISFKVMGGTRNLTPTEVSAVEMSPLAFTASWIPCSDCDFQIFSAYTKNADGTKAYLPGFENLRLDTATASMRLEGLTPSTTYYVTVVAATDYEMAETIENAITTDNPTFDMLPVESREPELLPSGNGFTARWDALADADSYELTVKKRAVDNEVYSESCDFTGKKLLDGWTGKTSSYFSASGYYGEAAPAASLAAEGDYVESAGYRDVKSLSFWTKTMSYSSFSKITVKGFTGKEWEEIASIPMAQTSEAGKTYAFSAADGSLKAGYKSIRLEMTTNGEKAGRFLIDDIKVSYNTPYVDETLPAYDHLNVGNATSHAVDGLEGNQYYVYTVRGYNGNVYSLESEEQMLYIGMGGVDDVDLAATSVAMHDGQLVVATQPTTLVIVYAPSGALMAEGNAAADGQFKATLPGGIYIVRVGAAVFKVAGR